MIIVWRLNMKKPSSFACKHQWERSQARPNAVLMMSVQLIPGGPLLAALDSLCVHGMAVSCTSPTMSDRHQVPYKQGAWLRLGMPAALQHMKGGADVTMPLWP